jgi:hypothetical protein
MDKVSVYDHLAIAVLEVGKVLGKDLFLNLRGFWVWWKRGHTAVSDPMLLEEGPRNAILFLRIPRL